MAIARLRLGVSMRSLWTTFPLLRMRSKAGIDRRDVMALSDISVSPWLLDLQLTQPTVTDLRRKGAATDFAASIVTRQVGSEWRQPPPVKPRKSVLRFTG